MKAAHLCERSPNSRKHSISSLSLFNTFDKVIESMEKSGEGTPEASSHQSQTSESMGNFLCRGDNSLHQKLVGSSMAEEKQDRANIFWEPSGRLLEHSCQQVCPREDLWMVA